MPLQRVQGILRSGLRLVLKLAAVSAVTVGVHTWLSASGPVALAVMLGVLVVFAVDGVRIFHGVYRFVSLLVLGTAAFLLVAQAVVVPLGAYFIWLDLAADGDPGGAVSFVFVLFTALFSAAAVSIFEDRPRTAFASLGAWAAILASLVFAMDALLALAALLLASALPRTINLRTLTVVSIASAGALLVGPVMEPAGSGLVDRILAPGLRAAILEVAPRFPLVADVPGYGHRLDSRNLGGTPLLSEAQLYAVEGPPSRAIYFRTGVFIEYDGRSWSYREREAFGAAGQDSSAAAELPSARLENRDRAILLRVVSDFVGEAAHTLDTVRIATSPAVEWERYGIDSGFVPDRPLVRGTQLRLYEAADRSDRGRLENEAGEGAPELDRYLALPDDLPDSVRELADELSDADDDDAFSLISRIRVELSRDAVYTLDPPRGDREDFVAGFLETRQGYCVHFATSFTVLARAAGLPARYVTGYRTRTDEAGTGRVTGLQAHAWSEVFVDGRWHTVEATPPMLAEDRAAGMRDREAARSADISDDRETRRQLEHMLADGSAADAGLPSWAAGIVAGYGRRIAVVLGLVAGVAAGGVVTSASKKRTRAHRKAGPLSKELSALLRCLPAGMADPRMVGWRAWARECEQRPDVRLRRCHSERIALLALSRTFGGRAVTGRDRRYIRLAGRYLKRRRGT